MFCGDSDTDITYGVIILITHEEIKEDKKTQEKYELYFTGSQDCI